MKQILLSLLIFSGLFALGPVYGRTWTSSDGSKTFSGDFKHYDEASGKVKVLRGFREVSFDISVLSDADQTWVKEKKAEVKSKPAAAEDETNIGTEFKEGILSKLDGKRFAKYDLDVLPEYYVLYFSASW